MVANKERKPQIDKAQEEKSLNLIERISYFELYAPIEADNDNSTVTSAPLKASACFNSWAIPEFMRHR